MNSSQFIHPVDVTTKYATHFLQHKFDNKVKKINQVGQGLWSKAFYFTLDNIDYVLRFGNDKGAYEKDKLASNYTTEHLQIPQITSIGVIDQYYFAISKRLPGKMLDELSTEEINLITPEILSLLDALRRADVSSTRGYGSWNQNQVGQYSSWRDFLLSVGKDHPESSIYGWRESLRELPKIEKFFNSMVKKLETLSHNCNEERHLIHSDLLHFNVLTKNNKITGVIDWGNSMYGDFLYDVANFTFWSTIHQSIRNINWENEVKNFLSENGVVVDSFEERLRICELHLGLTGMAWNIHTKNWTELEQTCARVAELFGEK